MGEFDNKVVCTKSKIVDVADAIRYKLSESDTYTLDEMPDKVRAISGGGSAVIEPLSITQNGTYTATGNVDGYSPITVAVAPDLEDITITQNGTYNSQSHDGFDEVIVNVSTSANLQTLNVTTNGTYTPTSPVDGYDEVVVNVAEPLSKVVSEFDFEQAEYDLVRSINPDDASATHKAIFMPYLYNASYNSENGYVSWSNYYGNIQPKFFINPFTNYVIDINFGVVGNDYQSSSNREILSIGDQMKLYWNTNGYFRRENSSGSENWVELDSRDYLSNKILTISIQWALSTTNSPTCYINLIFDDLNGGTITKFFGNWDGVGAPTLIIGRRTSDNGLYPVQVKGIKITESKWQIEPSSRTILAGSEESNNEEQR